LHEPAAPDALLCVGAGKTLYIGALDDVGWHRHGAPVIIAGLAGAFRLRLPGGDWTWCRSAVIPAGIRHALDLGGDPLAVFYPEPNVAGLSALATLGRHWSPRERILLGMSPAPGVLRELYEHPASLEWSGEALDDLVGHARHGGGEPPLDARLARVLAFLDGRPEDLTRASRIAREQGLSESRFLHLFSERIGVPFRRYRIWNRVRAAMRLALDGSSFTDAALHAGFADSAHFARSFRETFGVTPSYVFGKVARAGALPTARLTA
jgi:AraC-like DNA-binding protein